MNSKVKGGIKCAVNGAVNSEVNGVVNDAGNGAFKGPAKGYIQGAVKLPKILLYPQSSSYLFTHIPFPAFCLQLRRAGT